MAEPGDLRGLVDDPEVTYEKIRSFLDELEPTQRCSAIKSVGGKKRMAKLFELAGAGRKLTVKDMIPADRDALDPVIFHGKNSLFAFTLFQKRFCRPEVSSDEKTLYGYNEHAFRWFTGPGYFVVRETDNELGSLAIDYTQVPSTKPESWPTVKPAKGIGSLVYGNMFDYLRELADGVLIGRAVKKGKVTNKYFLLAREPLE